MSGYPRRRGELVQAPSNEGWTVYEPETDALHVLNASAKAIWELCDGDTSPAEMAEAIAELTRVDRQQAMIDVQETLDSLVAISLVTGA